MEKRYLFTPGPTPVPPEVLAAGAEPMVHHRGSDFQTIYTRTLERLQQVFRTREPGAALQRVRHGRDGVRGHEPRGPGRQGRGRRRRRVRRALGQDLRAPRPRRAPHRLRLGRGSRAGEIGSAVAESGAGIVLCTQSETSTGVVADVQGIKAAVGDAIVVVDAVSSLGAVPLETDAWGIDVVVSGLAEGADVPAGPRDGERRRAALGHAAARRAASTSTGARRGRRSRSSTRRSRRPSR